MAKTFLFDLDGTLIDSLPLIRETFQKVFQKMDIPWENGKVMETVGMPLVKVAEQYAGDKAGHFFDLYLKLQSEKHDEYTKLFPGAFEILESISRNKGNKIGVVTSKRRETARRATELTKIKSFIHVMIAYEDVISHKPDPEPVLKAMKLLNGVPEDTLYIGDSWYDVIAGNKAGVTTIGVSWGMAERSKLMEYKPNYVIDKWEEMFDIIGHR